MKVKSGKGRWSEEGEEQGVIPSVEGRARHKIQDDKAQGKYLVCHQMRLQEQSEQGVRQGAIQVCPISVSYKCVPEVCPISVPQKCVL
jgi:hypothetical protein